MGRIHPLVFISVGLLVGGFSAYVTYIENGKGFQLFLLAGIAMLIYGIVMWLIHRSPTDRIEKKDKHVHKQYPKKHMQQFNQWFMYCPYCGSRIPNNSIFCPYCGRRIR